MTTFQRLLTISSSLLIVAAGVAHADTNPTPIAVPLIGTSGAASPYPSSLNVQPSGGALQKGQVLVLLHSVTHPCLDDLAVLLVHNHTDKYLLMSRAGGCHPLNGSDIWFEPFTVPIPDDDTPASPLGVVLETGVANYGPQPVFPSPAPPGPYDPHLPPDTIQTQGTWDLYVADLGGSNRGVVAGGWTLSFSPTFSTRPSNSMPVGIPDNAPATTYPITFDLTGVRPEATIHDTTLSLWMTHPTADDVRVVLETPSGRKVMVMANAGGTSDLMATQELYFGDGAGAVIPDNGPLGVGTPLYFRPGSVYAGAQNASLPAPAPPAPYALAFSDFLNEPAQGIWKLWVIDDQSPFGGGVLDAVLTVNTDVGPLGVSIVKPATTPVTSTEPFLHLEALMGNIDRPFAAFWRNDVNGAFYANGGVTRELIPFFLFTGLRAEVPLQGGINTVRLRIVSESGYITQKTITVNVPEFTYTLSEGSTGGFFDEDVTIGNATDAPASVRVDFLQEGAAPLTHTDTVQANAPLQLHVDDLVPGGAVSTVVHSTSAVPLAVERTMSWDSSGYGGSGGTAISPNTTWLFAEGSQGYFDTFLLLANDNDADAPASLRFLLEGGGPVDKTVNVPAHKRVTIYAGDIPELINRSFGVKVTVPEATPITAERSMYFPHNGARLWEGGHEAAGVNNLSTHWYLAEGATGPFFECFVLLSNPQPVAAHVTLTYLLSGGGGTITQNVDVPADGRTTINVETVDPRLANAAVSTVITSNYGIIVERSMYWPDISQGWQEAHNSPGVVDPALRWGVSDIRVGGPRAHQTYILLANPNPVQAEVQVRLLRPGATPITQTYTLAPTSRTNVTAADLSGNVAGTFSAEVQVLNYQPIVVEKALYWNSGDRIWAAGTGVVATPFPPR